MKNQAIESVCEINPESLGSGTAHDFAFDYIDISSVSKGRIDWSQVRRLTYANAPSRARRRLRDGDVLLCTVRPGLKAHARIEGFHSVPRVGSTGFTVLRPTTPSDSAFIFHQLFSDGVAAQLRSLEMGSNYPAVNENDVRRVSFFAPEFEERRRIGVLLDTLDEAIAKTEAVIAKLKQVQAGLLHDLLTCGLDENGQLRAPLARPEQFQESAVGNIPIGWAVRSLESVTEPSAPICYGIVQAFDYVADGVPVLAIRDLSGDFFTGVHRTSPEIDAAYARSRVRHGDVLISIKGTIGRLAVVPEHYSGNISRDLARIRPVEGVSARFLFYLLSSPMGQRTLEIAQVGTTRAELSIAPLRQLPFAFPPTREQETIAHILNEQGVSIQVHEKNAAKLRWLKAGMMSDLLTGRVRVPEQGGTRESV